MHRVIFLSVIFTVLFNIPIFYLKLGISNNLLAAFCLEMLIILPLTIILFYTLSLIPYIGSLLLTIFFMVGIVSNFFIFTFKKSFDSGVLADILSVERSLIFEYINIYLVFMIVVSFASIYYVINKLVANKTKSSWKTNIIVIIVLIILIAVASRGFQRHLLGSTISNYYPFNLIYSAKVYIKKYRKQAELAQKKNDLTKQHLFELNNKNKDPVIVVLIIGESMRGDKITQYNMPLLFTRKNLINFVGAISSSTSTRISLPYMLTSAVYPHFEQALSEKSIISIFKHLDFQTSWIGSQGIFGIHEASFASIALEADYTIIKDDLNKAFPHDIICDECLIPFFDVRLKDQSKNQFIIVHLIGSHWRFDKRIPKNFKKKFLPECTKVIHTECTQEEINNSYANTLYYSDQVLDRLLTKLENKNSIVIYSSDHGFSLGESGFFGNAYQGSNTPKEQLDIAMFAWASDSFINNYQTSYSNIKYNINKKLSHDYIFHSLLDCIGVKSKYLNKNLSICSKNQDS